MKKRVLIMVLLTMLVAIFAIGCDNDKGSTNNNNGNQTINNNVDEDDENEISEAEEKETNTANKVDFEVYSPNADMTGLVKTEVALDNLTPQAVVDELVKVKTLTSDIVANSITPTQADGEEAVILDLSSNFATMLSQSGSSGERLILGAVVDTFLDAYDVDRIKITVDGKDLSTASADYTGFMGEFTD